MAEKRVIANSIGSTELARVTHDVVAERWDNMDLTQFLAYLVDTCAAAALPYLAEQFGVDGLRGFAIAQNEQEQRELIKKSIRLWKLMGTPAALRMACEAAGFTVFILDEGVPSTPPDPTTDWARFRLFVGVDETRPITGNQFGELRVFVEMYKAARCHLVEFGIYLPFGGEKLFRDIYGDGSDAIYNGNYIYDGSITYGGLQREVLEIQIIGEPMEWYDVMVDDDFDFLMDDNGDVIIAEFDLSVGKGGEIGTTKSNP